MEVVEDFCDVFEGVVVICCPDDVGSLFEVFVIFGIALAAVEGFDVECLHPLDDWCHILINFDLLDVEPFSGIDCILSGVIVDDDGGCGVWVVIDCVFAFGFFSFHLFDDGIVHWAVVCHSVYVVLYFGVVDTFIFDVFCEFVEVLEFWVVVESFFIFEGHEFIHLCLEFDDGILQDVE